MVGIYYAAPLPGPAIGPLMGDFVTQLISWRATFYFLVIFGWLSLISSSSSRTPSGDSIAFRTKARSTSQLGSGEDKLGAKEKALRLEHEDNDGASIIITGSELEAQPELA